MCIIESTFVCYLTSLLISGRCSVIQSTKCQQKGNWLAEMCYPVKWVFSRFLVNWMIVLYPVKMVSFCENWYKITFLRLICKKSIVKLSTSGHTLPNSTHGYLIKGHSITSRWLSFSRRILNDITWSCEHSFILWKLMWVNLSV